MASGSASVTVCSNNNVCQTLPVTVGSTSSGSLVLGQTYVTIAPGQSDAITLSGGSGTYYVSSNSNGNVASAVVSSASVVVSGIAAGTANVSVCSSAGQCSTIYVTVSGSTTTVTNTGSALTLTQVLSVGQGINILLSGGTTPYSISSNQSSAFSATINSGNVLTLIGLTAGQSSVTVCSANSICMPVYVAVTGTSGTSGTTTTSSQYVFTTFLTYGSTGEAVTALQKQLTADGLYGGSITGYYGTLTTAAVKAFQTKHGINAAGYVGPSTRAALNAGE
jgi:ferredoxin